MTSFTTRRERSERGSLAIDAMKDSGCPRTASELCSDGEPEGEDIHGFVPGVLDLAADRLLVAVPLSGKWRGWACRTQPDGEPELNLLLSSTAVVFLSVVVLAQAEIER